MAASALMLGLSSAALAAGGPDLDVAFIGSLSGPDAYKAQDALDGFRLGIKHLAGRLGGVEFDLAPFDDHHNPDVARAAMERVLHDMRPQFVLVSSDAKITGMLAQMADAGRVFLLVLNAPPPNLAGRDCRPYVFSLAGLTDTVNEQAGQYMAGQGYRRVMLAAPANGNGQAAADAFRRGFRGDASLITSHRGEMNFSAEFKQISQAKPDAVYLLETGGMAVNFIRQYDEAGMRDDYPLFGPSLTLDQAMLAGAAPSSVDLFSVGPWSEDMDTPSNKKMMADFDGEYGRPASYYAAVGYDAAMLMDSGIRGTDHKYNEDEMMRTALRRTEFIPTRPGFHFDTNHMPIQNYVLRAAVRDAKGRMTNEQRGILQRDVRDGHAQECAMRWVVSPVPVAKPVAAPAAAPATGGAAAASSSSERPR